MKFNMTFRLMGMVLDGIVKKSVPDREVQKNIKKTYREARSTTSR